MGSLAVSSDILGLYYTSTAVDKQATISVRVPQDRLARLLPGVGDACRHLSKSTATVRTVHLEPHRRVVGGKVPPVGPVPGLVWRL